MHLFINLVHFSKIIYLSSTKLNHLAIVKAFKKNRNKWLRKSPGSSKKYYGCGGAVLAVCMSRSPAKHGYNIASCS